MDKTNGKMTSVEFEMALDYLKDNLPYIIKQQTVNAKVIKSKYDSLIAEGFSEKQALEIVKTRPVIE